MWSVAPPSLEEATERFDSDKIQHTSTLAEVIQSIGKTILHTLPVTTEYPALPVVVTKCSVVEHLTDHLLTALHTARLTKDEFEIDLIREGNRISSMAHEVLIRELGAYSKKRGSGTGKTERQRTGKEGVKEWEVESEGDAEAVFVAACRRAG